jgi:hypothetical protein
VRYLLKEKTPSEKETGTYANGKIGGSNRVTTSSTIILATVPASMFAIAKASVYFVK